MTSPPSRPLVLGLTLGLLYHPLVHRQAPIHLDGHSSSVHHAAQLTLPTSEQCRRDRGRRLRLGTVRKITSGSILGLCTGLVLTTVSRPLLMLIGALGLGALYVARQLRLAPSQLLRSYMDLDLKRLKSIDGVWMTSFTVTLLMAGYMKF